MDKKMKRLLVFWPVMAKGLDRRDSETDVEIWRNLPPGSRVYDLDKHDGHGPMADMANFVEDYNYEELDGGFWCAFLTIPESLMTAPQ